MLKLDDSGFIYKIIFKVLPSSWIAGHCSRLGPHVTNVVLSLHSGLFHGLQIPARDEI